MTASVQPEPAFAPVVSEDFDPQAMFSPLQEAFIKTAAFSGGSNVKAFIQLHPGESEALGRAAPNAFLNAAVRGDRGAMEVVYKAFPERITPEVVAITTAVVGEARYGAATGSISRGLTRIRQAVGAGPTRLY